MELHLQEGFVGQRVTVQIDGKLVVEVEHMTTRLMLGLAQIIKLDVAPDQEVLITIHDDPDVERRFTVRPDRPFVTVTQTEDGWQLDFPQRAPGYA